MSRSDSAIQPVRATIYPSYVEAHKNLGAIYNRLGDQGHEREALQQAIRPDDHFAPAYINLARLTLSDRNFFEAEYLLTTARAIDPTHVEALVLLADAQLLNGHPEQALVTSRKAHTMGPYPKCFGPLHRRPGTGLQATAIGRLGRAANVSGRGTFRAPRRCGSQADEHASGSGLWRHRGSPIEG